jgi:hypothetical protein
VDVTPFSDSQPGHNGFGLFPGPGFRLSGRYEIDQNGTKVAGGPVTAGKFRSFDTLAALSPRPSKVRFTLAVSRMGKSYPLSGHSQTTWAWRSARPAPSAAVPPGWGCQPFVSPLLPPPGRHCAVQPMMTLRYAVAGMGLNGSAAPGRQLLRLWAGHLQLAKAAAVTHAAVRVSFDDGATWRDAAVSGRAGRYLARYRAPATARYVSLRTTARDAAGGLITETLTRAYRIAHAPAARSPRAAAVRAACPRRPGQARCLALFSPQTHVNAAIAARAAGRPVSRAATTPKGWGAKDIEAAYKLPVSRDPHQTVAVVDAQSTPHLASDLAVYRKHYNLPPCTAASGCLRIVNQKGKPSPLPRADPAGWGVEETLDVEMVSAACPDCKILLVEAASPRPADLAAAENTAARLGAQVISNSYGARESGFTQAYARAFRHPGHVIVVSSGDIGFTAASFPANLATVTAVGGTQLARARNPRGWAEKAWYTDGGASGSGCSAYVPKPAWQADTRCPGRTVADVAAVAWNIPIYDSSLPSGTGGPWLSAGGTSASAPLIAGVYALAGNAAKVPPGYSYGAHGGLFDITRGNNDWLHHSGGVSCGHSYLCEAKKGYDAPTGLGTPNGTSAF